jgi:signal peptidase I
VFLAAFRFLASFDPKRPAFSSWLFTIAPKASVPDGMCLVLGDNRSNSRDSRTVGFVALGDVLGDGHYRYWPAAKWTRFGVLTE